MKKFLVLFLVCMFFSSCGYGEDVDNNAYVIAIGIDKGETYPLKVTFVFADPNGSSSSSGDKKPASPENDIVTVEGITVFSAARKLDAVKSRKLNLTHTKIVVFSDEIAKEGIKTFLSGFASSRDFRPNTYVAISMGEAQKYLSSVKPAQETFIEKYYDNIMKKVVSDKVNEAYLYYLFFNVSEESSGSLVPLAGVNENGLKPKDSAAVNTDDFGYEATAGKILLEAENKSEFLGSAVLSNDKMMGVLGSFETDLSRIICDEFYPENYSINYPDTINTVTIRIIQQQSPHIKTKIEDNIPEIHISVPISIEYIDAGKIQGNSEKSDEFCHYLEKILNSRTKALINKSQKQYKSDFLGLGDFFKHHFTDEKNWSDFNWSEKYPGAKIHVSFRVIYADFEETH